MKMMKKFSALILTFGLVVSMLSGCAGDNGNGNTESITQESRATDAGGSETSPADTGISEASSQRYEEEVTITAALCYTDAAQSTGEIPVGITPETNAYIQLFKDELNINLEFIWIVNADQFAEKWGVSVASGELPDVFFMDSDFSMNYTASYRELRDQGALYDLSSVYEEYASEAARAYFDDGYELLKSLENGSSFALSTGGTNVYYNGADAIFYRQDWLDALGLSVPETMDEFENVMEKFSEADFGGTGGVVYPANNLYYAQGLADFTPVFNAYGAFPSLTIWQEKDGEVINSATEDGTLEALKKLNSWYTKGWINQDFASINVWDDGSSIVSDIVAGKYGIVPGSWWIPNWPLNEQMADAIADEPKLEWVAGIVPVVEGYDPIVIANESGNMGTLNCVSATCKNPEALIKMINLWIEAKLCVSNPSVEGTEKAGWGRSENGYIDNWLPFKAWYGDTLIDNYTLANKLISEGRDEVNENEMPYNTEFWGLWDAYLTYRDNPTDGIAWGQYYSRLAEDGGLGLQYSMEQSRTKVKNVYNANNTYAAYDKYASSIQDFQNETFLKMVMGETSLSEWSNFVNQWKALGGEAIQAEVTETMNTTASE